MKRTVPLFITATVGFVLIGSSFVPAAQAWGDKALIWFNILAAIAFVLGGGNLVGAQLRKISHRRAGWGYAAVTLVSFLVMLLVGLFKVGSLPAPNQEFFGQTFARIPLNSLPEFQVAAPDTAALQNRPLPASVRKQVRVQPTELSARGWLSAAQIADLMDVDPRLEWKCAVERLQELARPPQEVRGRLSYLPDHGVLSFQGAMTEADEGVVRGVSAAPEFQTAVEQIAEVSRRETSISLSAIPAGIAIPPSLNGAVTVGERQLRIQGPMSPAQRTQLIRGSLASRRVLSGDPARAQELVQRLRDAGPLNDEQAQLVERTLLTDVSDALIAVVNTAGVTPGGVKTACQLVEERNQGIVDLDPNIAPPPPSVLNADQEQAIRDGVGTGQADWGQLQQQLASAGPMTPAQIAAIDQFRDQLPTAGERNRQLFAELVKLGEVNVAQRELLLAPYAEERQWQNAVQELFTASHQVKYPWSGNPLQQGAAFWWLYEYVMQPITSMLFALLAFYVASAAFRAFRAKNLEATLLLGTAFVILLGRTYAGVLLTGWLPESLSAFRLENLSVFLMAAFNAAGNRAIMIGIALGIASTSLKILLGIDRSHVGGKD